MIDGHVLYTTVVNLLVRPRSTWVGKDPCYDAATGFLTLTRLCHAPAIRSMVPGAGRRLAWPDAMATLRAALIALTLRDDSVLEVDSTAEPTALRLRRGEGGVGGEGGGGGVVDDAPLPFPWRSEGKRAAARRDAATARDALGTPLVSLAAGMGAADVVGGMLAAGASANAADGIGRPPLCYAASAGSAACVRLLLAAGANVNAADAARVTPLMCAVSAYAPSAAAVATLLTAGAHVLAADATGATAVAYAVRTGHLPLVRVLHDACRLPREQSRVYAQARRAVSYTWRPAQLGLEALERVFSGETEAAERARAALVAQIQADIAARRVGEGEGDKGDEGDGDSGAQPQAQAQEQEQEGDDQPHEWHDYAEAHADDDNEAQPHERLDSPEAIAAAAAAAAAFEAAHP